MGAMLVVLEILVLIMIFGDFSREEKKASIHALALLVVVVLVFGDLIGSSVGVAVTSGALVVTLGALNLRRM